MKKYNSENEFQNKLFVSLVRHELQYKDLFIYHVPNGGFRDKITARIMQWVGMRKGISDLHIIGGGKILFIELKVGNGKQSSEQKVFEQKVKANNMQYWLINDTMPIDEIVDKILTYLYN